MLTSLVLAWSPVAKHAIPGVNVLTCRMMDDRYFNMGTCVGGSCFISSFAQQAYFPGFLSRTFLVFRVKESANLGEADPHSTTARATEPSNVLALPLATFARLRTQSVRHCRF